MEVIYRDGKEFLDPEKAPTINEYIHRSLKIMLHEAIVMHYMMHMNESLYGVPIGPKSPNYNPFLNVTEC